MGDRVGRFSLYGVVFVSGVAALVFEALFFRMAGLALGNGVWAVTIVLSSFMAGLGLGNAFMSTRGDRVRNPLRVYAILELVIGASGLLLVLFLPVIQRALVPLFQLVLDTPLLNPLRLGISFLLMLAPAVAMGMTLPVLIGALTRRRADFGKALGGNLRLEHAGGGGRRAPRRPHPGRELRGRGRRCGRGLVQRRRIVVGVCHPQTVARVGAYRGRRSNANR